MDKKERFEKAYNYLKFKGVIKKQEDVAKAMGATRANVSLALNGNPAVLTDNFLMRFTKAYSGIFNFDWLISGDGEMLTINQPQTQQETSKSNYIDNGSILNALLAAKDETIAAMQDQLAAKEEIIQAKDELIAALRAQLAAMNYEKEIDKLGGYPRDRMASEPQIAPNR